MNIAQWTQYAIGQCTEFVASQLAWIRQAGNLGNAGDWLGNAGRYGLTTSAVPVAGSVAVWSPYSGGAHSVGHVAVVESVGPSAVQVREENWTLGPGGIDSRTVPRGDITGYILPPAGSTFLASSGAGSGSGPIDPATGQPNLNAAGHPVAPPGVPQWVYDLISDPRTGLPYPPGTFPTLSPPTGQDVANAAGGVGGAILGVLGPAIGGAFTAAGHFLIAFTTGALNAAGQVAGHHVIALFVAVVVLMVMFK